MKRGYLSFPRAAVLAVATGVMLVTGTTQVRGVLPEAEPDLADDSQLQLELQLERGRYLTRIAGCNDCHTRGFAERHGQVPEAQWLTGDTLGWRGPWGTTYPANLRKSLSQLSEEQWLQLARTIQTRPPMPWFVLRDMSDEDLRAIYKFVRHLEPSTEPVPVYVPPDREPSPPYLMLVSPTP
ncbi:MAG: cytochrome C [Gammaproteobacteria bacterium]|nr:cytochrome C [Gammaproteobacteria bacterium]